VFAETPILGIQELDGAGAVERQMRQRWERLPISTREWNACRIVFSTSQVNDAFKLRDEQRDTGAEKQPRRPPQLTSCEG
jgi:hypothetical protein